MVLVGVNVAVAVLVALAVGEGVKLVGVMVGEGVDVKKNVGMGVGLFRTGSTGRFQGTGPQGSPLPQSAAATGSASNMSIANVANLRIVVDDNVFTTASPLP